MQRQFRDVDEFWSKYKALATSDDEMAAISEFEDLWRQAMDAGNAVVSLHDQASQQFANLHEQVDLADDVIDFKMQLYIQKRIRIRDDSAKMARAVTIWTGLVAVMGAVVICLIIARSITGPIRYLKLAADEFGKGNLEYRIASRRKDELGDLSRTFDCMGRELARSSQRISREVTERKQMMEQMQEFAFHDALTGLPNRASILRSIQHVIDRGDGKHFALLFLDFDRFKLINDSLGHDVGDKLLKEIAHRLQEILQASDEIVIPARLGGDEFVVLLDNLSSLPDASVVAERLLQVFSQSFSLDGPTVYSTASIGIVTSDHRFESACDMLRDADLAMYESKAAGKACYTVFDQALRTKAQARLRIENEMRDSITRDEFVLVYQPIMSLKTGQMEGAEALLRWMHPESGMIGPDEFIPVAEETGMIIPLGSWVINEACRQLAKWHHSPRGSGQSLCVHVNVSRRQLLFPSLTSVVEQALAEHAIPPKCLHLEVTESVIMEDPKTATAVLNEMRKLGVKIDIDDFGTGYSSLSCIHEFPIDVLKIDRSFIANIEESRELMALLQAVLTLADNLDLPVVAEGIEDIEQLTLLQALGCEYGQGYLFAKPTSSAEVEQFLGSTFGMMPRESEVLSTTAPVNSTYESTP